jgi:hypothetical protein
MSNEKLRRQIAFEAARLMYQRQESEYYRAKLKAGKRLSGGWVKPQDLPSNAEIRDQIQSFARLHEGSGRLARLREMRLEALRLMRILATFRPRLILVRDRFPFEITIYGAKLAHYVFKSSITGKPIERASLAQLESLIRGQYGDANLDQDALEAESKLDRFQIYEMLLLPLERVKQSPKWHPEGDALYHSLQVFDLARDELPYDEEFLLAALLHDVGKGIDPADHVAAGLEALDGYITERTRWLIEHHMLGHAHYEGTLGSRVRHRLSANESFEELLLLAKCDRAGRQRGVATPEVDEALEYLRDLAQTCGE